VSDDVAPGAADAVRDTLGGAVGAADQVPAGVLDAATSAFVEAMNAVAAVNAGAMVLIAILTAVLLRRVGVSDEPGAQIEDEVPASAVPVAQAA
jgi:DHA2 family multidrug resistance protein-like MFS transporter